MAIETVDAQISSIEAQIKGIEVQLATLKSQIEALAAQVKQLEPSTRPKTLGDLRGILAGLPDFTEEEIDAALYRYKWEEDEATPG